MAKHLPGVPDFEKHVDGCESSISHRSETRGSLGFPCKYTSKRWFQPWFLWCEKHEMEVATISMASPNRRKGLQQQVGEARLRARGLGRLCRRRRQPQEAPQHGALRGGEVLLQGPATDKKTTYEKGTKTKKTKGKKKETKKTINNRDVCFECV